MASRTLHAYVRASLGEADVVPGVISLAQSFGSLARWHPHLHLVVTDGGFRRDGSFVTQWSHDAVVLAKVGLASDARDGPYAGVHRIAAVEFLARLVDHIPGKGEVCTRYYGAYATRRRAWWRRRGVVLAGAGHHEEAHEPEREMEPWPALKARRRRWADLLRLVFVHPINCRSHPRTDRWGADHAPVPSPARRRAGVRPRRPPKLFHLWPPQTPPPDLT